MCRRSCAHLLGFTLLLAACAKTPPGPHNGPGDAEKLLNIYSWADYIAPNTVANFEKETGIKVRYDTYDSNEILETRLLTGHTNYDIVVPTGDFFEHQVQAGVFRILDQRLLTNRRNLDPDILQRLAQHDPGNLHGMPYLWSAAGIGYNVSLVDKRLGKAAAKSWSMLFDPRIAAKLADCGIAVLDAPADVISSVMIYLGHDANSRDSRDLREAVKVLMDIRPYVRNIDSVNYISDLANGGLCLVLGWSGDVIQARDRAKDAGTGTRIAFFVPAEGGIMTVDAMGIPADAPHPINAQLWMNYLMRPKVMADITNAVKYPNGNLASTPFVDPALTGDPSTYPPAQIRAKLRVHRAQPLAFSRSITREWTRFRSGG